MEINSYTFDINGFNELSNNIKGKDWPVVYLIHNDDTLYIGETTSASTRMNQHLNNPNKQKANLKMISVVFDDRYNKSVILDFEQKLIKYCKTDQRFKNILNRNAGQSSTHDYYLRDEYYNDFKDLWAKMIEEDLATHSIDIIENENIFKFSPYNSLTREQEDIATDVINDIVSSLENKEEGISLINGCAGTGKTVLAISIINSLINAKYINEDDIDDEDKNTEKVQALLRLKDYTLHTNDLNIGFVVPMSGIRKTLKKVFKQTGYGLNADMVLGPNDVVKKQYDILFVDESHRLTKRKNIVNYKSFNNTCEFLNLDPDTSNQLDWILKSAKYKVLFYDQDQTIKASDISYDEYMKSIHDYASFYNDFTLETQMRCAGGKSYTSYIKDIMNCHSPQFKDIVNYDFKIFDDVDVMINKIKSLDDEMGLCKNVAGYSWPWKTKNYKTLEDILVDQAYDIDIGNYHYIWNLSTEGWLDREDSRDTIGCIHTTQGYDLNYVGVIFGKEIDYDPTTNQIVVDLNKFYDKNVKNGTDPDVVKTYIINTYTTMMARGIKGCYVYACNENLRNYLKKYIKWGEE